MEFLDPTLVAVQLNISKYILKKLLLFTFGGSVLYLYSYNKKEYSSAFWLELIIVRNITNLPYTIILFGSIGFRARPF